MKRRNRVETHAFARALLSRPNEFIRMWGVGRLWLVWDTNKSAPQTVPTRELIPAHGSGGSE